MHRSGTSIITKFLECFDINIGSDFFLPRIDNKQGFFEDISFYRINRKILEKNELEWNTIIDPTKLKLNLSELNQRDVYHCNIIKNINNNLSFAFKDPRIQLTLSYWKKFLNNKTKIEYIYCFRHPRKIFNSIKKRDKMNAKDINNLILQNWYLMTKNITDLKKTIFIDYDKLIIMDKGQLEYLSKKFNTKINKKKFLFFKKNLIKLKNRNKYNYTSYHKMILLENFYKFYTKPTSQKKNRILAQTNEYYKKIKLHKEPKKTIFGLSFL